MNLPRLVFTTLCLAFTSLSQVTAAAASTAPPLPRNILLIMADDIGIEGFGCYGGTSYQTPHLDQLAAGGMRFSHAYSQPLCTPTRVQLMTGKYNQRNWQAFGIMPRGEKTIGHLMSSYGYRTLIAGKWQLTSYDPPNFPGATKRRNTGMHPRDAGFDEYTLHHAEQPEDMGSRYANPTYLRNGVLHTDEGAYGEDVATDYILDFMTRHRDEPMFVYYPMSLPHWPVQPTPDSEEWAEPSRRLEIDEHYFPDMVEYMDKIVGRLVAGIDKLGLRDDTLIIFYSDNGTDKKHTSQLGELTVVGGKSTPLQTGVRVPLIANWPAGTPAGVVNSDLVDASDFYPTLAALAGQSLSPAEQIDGHSFAPQLLGQINPSPREWCFFWYDPRPGSDKVHLTRAIFALDHNYKLFSDGRLFTVDQYAPSEQLVDPSMQPPQARAARAKLSAVIDHMMQPPLAPAALTEVDAYGDPIVR